MTKKTKVCKLDHCHCCAGCGYERPMTEGEAKIAKGLEDCFNKFGNEAELLSLLKECLKGWKEDNRWLKVNLVFRDELESIKAVDERYLMLLAIRKKISNL